MNGLEVKCVKTLQNANKFFAAIENPNDPPPDHATNITFPANLCFIDAVIDLQENETLTFSSPSNNEITSLTLFARRTGSMLSQFPVEMFNTFPNLEEVELAFTGLESLKEDDFVNATNLSRLYLEGNNIPTLGRAAFPKFKHLTVLTLQTNRIREIEDFTFANLDQLQGLYLQQNNLTSLKANVFGGLTKLRKLALDDNQIATIEDGALYLESLEELYLLGNNLKELSPDLLTFTPALRVINVSRNKLTSIGGAFGRSLNLHSIELSDNQIQMVDWIEFASIPSLRILSLRKNSLKLELLATEAADDDVYQQKLKNAMSQTKLEYLNLEDNELHRSDILRQLTAFRNLHYLCLDNNPFIVIDHWTTIREHFPNMIHVSVRNATLSCEWLEKTVSVIQKSKVQLVTEYFLYAQGPLKEIDGMVCVPPKTE